ncbi:MAG: signal peptidase II [Nanoarchaeota archaeon]|nr:signal peptidase II [Nanoarchaeota archaeon]MBU1623181.1 signal peptidase II [Nanoarchaeota archaeon]MBU1974568.1 signal peptidase II [Nanoarchaeota archaeon]
MDKFSFKYLFLLITILVISLDQLTKYLIVQFKPNFNLGLLTIRFIQNTGAGFGILKGQTILLGLVSLVVALGVIFYYKKIPKEKTIQVLWAVFLGGVIGNLIDRLGRKFVVDFIDFSFWPAFNLADACISVAVIGLIIIYWKK